MAMTRQKCKNDCIIHNTLDELVPQEHLVRKLDNCIDFTFIEGLVKDLYSDLGRPSIPPVVLFKLIFINMIFGINLMRRMQANISCILVLQIIAITTLPIFFLKFPNIISHF